MDTPRQLCTFALGEFLFGLDVLRVQEVIRNQDMTRVPLAAAAVRGLINLRGQIVTALDLRRRLGLPPRTDDSAAINVVVATGDGPVSLLVDEIGDVVEVDPASMHPAPDTVHGAARDVIRGAFRLRDRLLILVDADRITALSAKDAEARGQVSPLAFRFHTDRPV